MSHISLPNLLCQQHRVRWPPIASAINAQILVCALLCGADTPLQAEHTVPVLRRCVHSSLSNGLQRRVRVIVAPAVTCADLRLRLKGRLCLTSACRTCCASITV